MGEAVSARRDGVLCAAIASGALALLFSAPAAGADLEFCPIGEGAGQCGAPEDDPDSLPPLRGLAVDTETERLYVADESNNRINVFEVDEVGEAMDFLFAFGYGVADGTTNAPQTCTTTCFKGIAGTGAGQLDNPVAIAVDNDPGSPSQHAIYVSERGEDEGLGNDREHPRVQKFEPNGEFVWTIGEGVDETDGTDLCTKAEDNTCGAGAASSAEGGFVSAPLIAVGPGGVLHAVDNPRLPGDIIQQRLQRFEPTGAPIPPAVILSEAHLVFARAIAIDAAGDLWVTSQGAGLRKHCAPAFTACAGPFEAGAGFASGSLTIDSGGNLFAGRTEFRDNGLDFFNTITAYDPTSGAVTRRFAYSEFGGNSINGLAAHASGLGELFASRAEEGIAYLFEPPPGPVTAPPSLEVTEIGSAKATLVAEVNPEGKATKVHFEYLTEKEFQDQGESFAGPATKETTPESLAGGDTGFNLKTVEEPIGCLDPATEAGEPESKCLAPETTYRWRVVAKNAEGQEGAGPVEGPAFTTTSAPVFGEIWATRVGTDTARLHGELNPTDVPTTGWFEYVDEETFQASGFDEAGKAPNVDGGEAPLDFGAGDDFVARSVAAGPLEPGTLYHWRLVADSPLLVEPASSDAEELRTFAEPEVEESCANKASRIGSGAYLPDCRAYEMVSPLDKAGGDIRVLDTSLAEPAVHEQSSLDGEKLAYGSIRSFGGAVSAPYTSQYVARRVAGKVWETHPINPPRGVPIDTAIQQFDTEFKAFSPDLCQAWFRSFAEPPLSAAAPAGYSNLYRRTDELCPKAGEGRFEALAPLDAPSVAPGPFFSTDLLGLSANAEHAALTANDKITPQGSPGMRQLYEHVRGVGLRFVCILPGGTPVGGPCTAGSGAGPPGAQIGRISADGERIFWSTPGSGEGELYVRIDPDPTIEGDEETRAVSEEGEEESGTAGSWFWGAATDGSAAIFSTEVTPNDSDLYEFKVDGEETEPIAEEVIGVLGIGADAKRVYFASSKVLTGEEANGNGDKATPGKANLYLREADGSVEFIATPAGADLDQALSRNTYREHTSLVSPSGAHAAFVSVAPLTGYDNKDAEGGTPREQIYRYDAGDGELSCVSCNPSNARPAGRARIPFWQTPTHAARILSDDGSRLYFESADALAALDTNGKVDVYQWEEPGTGGCDEEDGSFSPLSGGCVDLVSSGQSAQGSRFVEASPTGNDVFFATVSSLLPQDFGSADVYDARLGGGLPIPDPIKPPCEGDTCAAQIPAPEEPTPASADYTAPPAAPEGKPAKRRCAKGKRRVQRKGKSRCVPKRSRRRAGR